MTELADSEVIDRLATDNARLYGENAELREQAAELQHLLDEAYRCLSPVDPAEERDAFSVDL